MEEMVFQIGPIRPPSEANSLLLRVTINCPWNKCKFCMLYKKYDFHTRPVEDVKKDIDTMAELRDRIKQYKTADGDWDIEAINRDYQTLTTDDQRWCYHMVFRWLTEGDSNSIFLQDAIQRITEIRLFQICKGLLTWQMSTALFFATRTRREYTARLRRDASICWSISEADCAPCSIWETSCLMAASHILTHISSSVIISTTSI